MNIRLFGVKPALSGFRIGFLNGLGSASVDFDMTSARNTYVHHLGMSNDVEAVRGDVGRARRRIAREIGVIRARRATG